MFGPLRRFLADLDQLWRVNTFRLRIGALPANPLSPATSPWRNPRMGETPAEATTLVTLFFAPAVFPTTLTLMVQEPLPATEPPVRLTVANPSPKPKGLLFGFVR
jgi:hypothetical protein